MNKKDTKIVIEITDNGKGFKVDTNKKE